MASLPHDSWTFPLRQQKERNSMYLGRWMQQKERNSMYFGRWLQQKEQNLMRLGKWLQQKVEYSMYFERWLQCGHPGMEGEKGGCAWSFHWESWNGCKVGWGARPAHPCSHIPTFKVKIQFILSPSFFPWPHELPIPTSPEKGPERGWMGMALMPSWHTGSGFTFH